MIAQERNAEGAEGPAAPDWSVLEELELLLLPEFCLEASSQTTATPGEGTSMLHDELHWTC